MVSRDPKKETIRVSVLLKLLLTNVESLLGSLALGEGVTIQTMSAIDDVIWRGKADKLCTVPIQGFLAQAQLTGAWYTMRHRRGR
jgi:hypothetical protein